MQSNFFDCGPTVVKNSSEFLCGSPEFSPEIFQRKKVRHRLQDTEVECLGLPFAGAVKGFSKKIAFFLKFAMDNYNIFEINQM